MGSEHVLCSRWYFWFLFSFMVTVICCASSTMTSLSSCREGTEVKLKCIGKAVNEKSVHF